MARRSDASQTAAMTANATDARPLRILIVDADHRVRDGLRDLISLEAGVEVVGAVGLTAAAIDLVSRATPDLVVVDPRLPDIATGLAFVSFLHDTWPDLRVLVMSWSASVEPEALASGAHALLDKTAQPEELLVDIVACARGEC